MSVPAFQALHPMAVDAPEECAGIIAQVFGGLSFDAMYRVPPAVRAVYRHCGLELSAESEERAGLARRENPSGQLARGYCLAGLDACVLRARFAQYVSSL